jgi:HemY protein
MIFKTIVVFLLLLFSVYLGIYLQQDSGYVLIVLHNWTIETTIWIVLMALALAIILVYFLIVVSSKLMSIPSSWKKWRASSKTQKSQAKTRQGLIEFNEGHWKLAKKNLIDALPNADTPLLNYLTAARAAQEMGDNTVRDDYLRQAQQSMPEARIAVELTQAQLQIANHQWEQALATLKHLQDLSPKHPYVLKLLMQLYEEIKDWTQLIHLLPIIKRNQILSKHTFLKKEQHIYLQELLNFIKHEQDDSIEQLIQKLPRELKADREIIYQYSKYLLSRNEHKKAENVLHKFLHKNVDEHLLELYSTINSEAINLHFIESLAKNNNNSSALYLCLGRISSTKQLWGKAQIYFEESIKIKPNPEAYEELGKLFEQLNNMVSACDAYRKGLNILNVSIRQGS